MYEGPCNYHSNSSLQWKHMRITNGWCVSNHPQSLKVSSSLMHCRYRILWCCTQHPDVRLLIVLVHHPEQLASLTDITNTSIYICTRRCDLHIICIGLEYNVTFITSDQNVCTGTLKCGSGNVPTSFLPTTHLGLRLTALLACYNSFSKLVEYPC